MQKPNNFDNVKTGGDFTPVELGGHHMIIKQVAERQSKKGKPMLVVLFDFAKNDKQPEYFSESFAADVRPEKKWPNNGTGYVVSIGDDGKCTKNFKSFIKAVEDSNPGFAVDWGDGPQFSAQFKNKKVGGVFGVVEEEYNGEIKKRHKLRWFCQDAAADGAKVPADKLLDASAINAVKVAPPVDANGFINVPDTEDEEIPF